MITAYDMKEGQPVRLDLYQIDKIEFYVQDCFTIDQMGFVFTCKSGESYFCHEDCPAYKETFNTLTELYPGISDSVWTLYRRANMSLEKTIVYDRQNGVIHPAEVEPSAPSAH